MDIMCDYSIFPNPALTFFMIKNNILQWKRFIVLLHYTIIYTITFVYHYFPMLVIKK